MVSHEYDVKGQGEKSESVFWGSVERIHHSRRIISISFTMSDDEVVSLTQPAVTITSKAYAAPPY